MHEQPHNTYKIILRFVLFAELGCSNYVLIIGYNYYSVILSKLGDFSGYFISCNKYYNINIIVQYSIVIVIIVIIHSTVKRILI